MRRRMRRMRMMMRMMMMRSHAEPASANPASWSTPTPGVGLTNHACSCVRDGTAHGSGQWLLFVTV
eukprot:3357235-Pyramimonas_sp.AAC.1